MAPYTSDALVGDVVEIEELLRTGADAADRARALAEALPCVDEVLPPAILARVYRDVAAGLDATAPDEADRWLRTAIELAPHFDYGVEDLPAASPVRARFDRIAAEPTSLPIASTGLGLDARVHWLDGRRITTPSATTNRPHLLQTTTDDALITTLISGSAFPDTVLATTGPVVPPVSVKPPVRAAPIGWVVPDRPREKTPLTVIGAVVTAGGASLYALAALNRDRFDATQNSRARLVTLRKTTNALVVGSAIVGTAGVATLGYALTLPTGKLPRRQRVSEADATP